jgi:ParB-like nuclease domain
LNNSTTQAPACLAASHHKPANGSSHDQSCVPGKDNHVRLSTPDPKVVSLSSPDPKDNHVRLFDADPRKVVSLPIDSIRPTPANNLIYRPVRATDQDIQELAESIESYGLQEPLVVSRDGFIISGHRRHAACRSLGWTEAKCRVKDILRSDPEFENLLIECNRQRVKSLDEISREYAIEINPQEAYKALIERRKADAAVSGDFLIVGDKKARKGISSGKRQMLDAVVKIINEQRKYWPLSDRQVHYELLNNPPLRHSGKSGSRYRNDKKSYQDLCGILTRARLSGKIPFAAIADPTRSVVSWDLHRETGGFLKDQLDGFLTGYWRDLMQSQPNHIEIVGEKNTVAGSIRPVAMEYCIPFTLGRGYCSLAPRYEMCERFRASGKQNLIVLILADFDPEGEDIANSFARSMRDDFKIKNVLAKKVCLTHEQVLERNLPQNYEIKKTSSRYKKFAKQFGDRAHELEALPSAERSRLLREAIDSVIDVELFNYELDAEKEDAANLAGLRAKGIPAFLAAVEPKQDEQS